MQNSAYKEKCLSRQSKESLFEAVGGLPVLQKVHKVFYDKVYAHPWLGRFFEGHSQEAIENRQTAFMAEKMGGPVMYMGKDLRMAHRQMYITQELFNVRQTLLKQSLEDCAIPQNLAQRWLKIDNAFKRQVVKDSIESFYRNTFRYEKRIIIPKPELS